MSPCVGPSNAEPRFCVEGAGVDADDPDADGGLGSDGASCASNALSCVLRPPCACAACSPALDPDACCVDAGAGRVCAVTFVEVALTCTVESLGRARPAAAAAVDAGPGTPPLLSPSSCAERRSASRDWTLVWLRSCVSAVATGGSRRQRIGSRRDTHLKVHARRPMTKVTFRVTDILSQAAITLPTSPQTSPRSPTNHQPSVTLIFIHSPPFSSPIPRGRPSPHDSASDGRGLGGCSCTSTCTRTRLPEQRSQGCSPSHVRRAVRPHVGGLSPAARSAQDPLAAGIQCWAQTVGAKWPASYGRRHDRYLTADTD